MSTIHKKRLKKDFCEKIKISIKWKISHNRMAIDRSSSNFFTKLLLKKKTKNSQ